MTDPGAGHPALRTPAPAGPAHLVETHSALLVFSGDCVYKTRKPLDLGFLDHRTVAARRAVSEAEVRLNSRLAPDVYRGVLEVRGTDGEPVDYVVQMRRLDPAASLARLVAAQLAGSLLPEHISLPAIAERIAEQIAALHAASPHTEDINATGTPEAVTALWRETIAHIRRLPLGTDLGVVLDDVTSRFQRYLAGRQGLLRDRVAAGRSVDGHGDLRADDIFCLPDGPRIIDCLEFDDRLRWGDGILDISFLVMDLLRLGAPELADHVLRCYCRHAADDAPTSLVWFYSAYRALVRAKVSSISATQLTGPAADAAAASARDHLAWADAALCAGRVRLVLVGGVSGSGKSALATNLAPQLDAVLLRSDELRDHQVPRDTRYSSAARAAVYAHMLDKAAPLLAAGRSVVLDATWLDPHHRERAATCAADCAADLVEIECTAPYDDLVWRIARRQDDGTDPSEATVAVLDAQLAHRAVWPEAIVVDTAAYDVRDPQVVARWLRHTPECGPTAVLHPAP